MKKLIPIVALLLNHFFVFGQEQIGPIKVTPANEGKTTSGQKNVYYKNGKLKKTGKYDANGKDTGEWKFYHENGQLESIGSFKNGEKIGEWKFYNADNKLKSIGNFENGKETGQWKTYSETGELFKIGSYSNGKRIGDWMSYHPNAQLAVLEKYADGKQIGNSKFYDQQGKRIKREQYFSEIEDLMKTKFEEFYGLLKAKNFEKAVNYVSEDYLKATSFSKQHMQDMLRSNFDNWEMLPDLKVALKEIEVQKPKKLVTKEDKSFGILVALMNFEMTVTGKYDKEELTNTLSLIEGIGKERYKIGNVEQKDGKVVLKITDKRLVVGTYNSLNKEVRFAMTELGLTYTLKKFLPKEIVEEIKSQL